MKIIVITLDSIILSVQSAENVTKISRTDSTIYMGEVESVTAELIEDGIDVAKLDEFIGSSADKGHFEIFDK